MSVDMYAYLVFISVPYWTLLNRSGNSFYLKVSLWGTTEALVYVCDRESVVLLFFPNMRERSNFNFLNSLLLKINYFIIFKFALGLKGKCKWLHYFSKHNWIVFECLWNNEIQFSLKCGNYFAPCSPVPWPLPFDLAALWQDYRPLSFSLVYSGFLTQQHQALSFLKRYS